MVLQTVPKTQQGQSNTQGTKPDQSTTPARDPDQLALDQAELVLRRSYSLQSGDLVKNMETLQKLDEACKDLKAVLDPEQIKKDRNGALAVLRTTDIQSRMDRVAAVEDSYIALSKKKNITKEEQASVDGFFKAYQEALHGYKDSLDAIMERLSVSAKKYGNPLSVFEAAKERYEKLLNAPDTTDHSSDTTADPKQLEAAEAAYLDAGVKLLAFKKIFVSRAQADVKKADDAFFTQFGF